MRRTPLRLLPFILSLLLSFHFASAQDLNLEDYRPLLIKNAERLGITPTDAADAVITHAYTDNATHLTYIYLQQAYQQIKVYNTIISVAFDEGSLQYYSGTFVKDLAAKAGSPVLSRSHTDAIRGAARHLHLNENALLTQVQDRFATENKYMIAADAIARKPIETTLYWTPSDDKQQVTLTWNVNIQLKDSVDWWNIRVDAQTGAFIQKDNWVVSEQSPHTALALTGDVARLDKCPETYPIPLKNNPAVINPFNNQQRPLSPPDVVSATYRVIPFPYESPATAPFVNEVSPWLKAGASNDAVTMGWHFDNASNYDITRGNNVFAFLDRQASNTPNATHNWPDTSATQAPSLAFIHNRDNTLQPYVSRENKKVALDNLFYWNNVIHDVTYQYGFTEAAGNFQRNNMGRGGTGNDHVLAQAQDSLGYNNANFGTPTDGASGVMQMYNWIGPAKFSISLPLAINGTYPAYENSLIAPNKLYPRGPVTGILVHYNDNAAGTLHSGCLPAANATSIAGNIAMIDATGGVGCTTYAFKIKNAQNAGAKAVIVYFPNEDIFSLGGNDNTITVPVIMIGKSTADLIFAQFSAGQTVNVTMSSGVYIDGDLDNSIVCHEYGHGVSNRLTGGPFGASCLSNAEQGGEGWSDYLALMLTTNWANAQIFDGPYPRPMGTFAMAQPASGSGIRNYPYSTNMSISPLTYAQVATLQQVHAIGEIWCNALWDMTWNIIQQQNAITPDLYNSSASGGNVVALNLVMTGMKLQPCNPGFLDARDAILAADSILYGYSHKCAIWNAFARRGMGFSAKQGSSSSVVDQTAAFDLPPGIILSKPGPLVVDANTDYTFTQTATCNCQPGTFTVVDTIPAGFTYVSSTPTATLNGNVLTFPSTAFASAESKTYSVTLRAPATGCSIDSVMNDNRETFTNGGFTSSGTSQWTPTQVRAHSTPVSWFAPNPGVSGLAVLTSAASRNPTAKPLSILSFWHNFRTETFWDGGVLEYSTNGNNWSDATPFFLNSSYNNTLLTNTPTVLAGRKAFSGNSKGWQQFMLDFSSFDTTPVFFRFRIASDNFIGVEGWYVDDIVRANGCGGIMRAGIYNGSGVRVDSASVPVFANALISLPLTLLSFEAHRVGGEVGLDWKTTEETEVKDFEIEWSRSGVEWSSVGKVNALNGTTNTYDFTHDNPVTGKNHYRIKMNDKDGQFTYSPIRIINFSEREKPSLVLVPNPANTAAVLYFSKDVKVASVKVYDAAGTLVQQIIVGAGVQRVNIPTSKLAPGLYFVETTGATRQITRMLVQH